MTPTAADVLIVGAGPAGAVLGGLLAREGMDVLLLEQARFPRPKPCGECLNPGALAMLRRLGLWEAAAPLEPVPLKGWRLSTGRRACDLDFPGGLTAAAVDRSRFDQALADWAVRQGARLEEGVRVTDLVRDAGGRVAGARAGRTEIHAGLTVGADGLRSVVARRLGLAGPGRVRAKVALTAHWEGVSGLADRGELHVARDMTAGIAPIGQGMANVVLVVPAAVAGGLKQEAALARWWPGLRERFSGARRTGPVLATGPFDRPVSAAAVPGALLAGDAAGYFDPFTGQGIYRALRSAELAAAAILRGERYDPAGEFAAAVRRQRWIEAAVTNDAMLQAGLWTLSRWPGAGRRLLGLVGDCQC